MEVLVMSIGEIRRGMEVYEISEAKMKEYNDKNRGGGWPRTSTGLSRNQSTEIVKV